MLSKNMERSMLLYPVLLYHQHAEAVFEPLQDVLLKHAPHQVQVRFCRGVNPGLPVFAAAGLCARDQRSAALTLVADLLADSDVATALLDPKRHTSLSARQQPNTNCTGRQHPAHTANCITANCAAKQLALSAQLLQRSKLHNRGAKRNKPRRAQVVTQTEPLAMPHEWIRMA